MMKGREAKTGPSADLLVCFPSRAPFNLMPRPTCSPGRASESNKRRHHHLRKSSIRAGAHQASPQLWVKAKSTASQIAEPTSPKVTCAGQIKVSHKTNACRNLQSVMKEIDTLHNGKKQRKKPNWAESLGIKREIMQFMTCLRSIRFDLRCFGSFPDTDITTEDDDEEEEEEDEEEEEEEEEEAYRENHVGIEESDDDTSRAAFSKWSMMLQESQNNGFSGEGNVRDDGSMTETDVPPPNALLLMRCRSAPAKSWLKANEAQEREDKAHPEEGKEKVEETNGQSLKSLMEKEKTKKENLVVMRYDSDFYKMSSDIAKETWIVGGLRDPLSKSRSWKI